MKYLHVIALLTLVTVSYVNGGEQGKHLFILSGQSNMAMLNPAISFTPAVEAAFGKDNVIVVKDAQNGQQISRWYKKWKSPEGVGPADNGDLYDRLMGKVNEVIRGKQLATVTFIWMQGETDAMKKGYANVYADSLKGLLEQVRADLGRKDINFVIGRISDSDRGRQFPQWETMRKIQVEFAEADPNGAWVDTDDMNDGKAASGKEVKNDVHYTVEGYKLLGQRFAASAIKLINKNQNKTDAKDGK